MHGWVIISVLGSDHDCYIFLQVQDQSYELIIHGLESSTSTADLKGYFEQYGDVSVAEVSLRIHVCVCVCVYACVCM